MQTNTMKTAAEENNVFEMLNDPPPQRHKLGTILLHGDAPKRKGNHLSNIFWGSHRGSEAATEVTAQ